MFRVQAEITVPKSRWPNVDTRAMTREVRRFLWRAREIASDRRMQAALLYGDSQLAGWWVISVWSWNVVKVQLQNLRNAVTLERQRLPHGGWSVPILSRCYISWEVRPVPEKRRAFGNNRAMQFWLTIGLPVLEGLGNQEDAQHIRKALREAGML